MNNIRLFPIRMICRTKDQLEKKEITIDVNFRYYGKLIRLICDIRLEKGNG
jgi:hypothetical protein